MTKHVFEEVAKRIKATEWAFQSEHWYLQSESLEGVIENLQAMSLTGELYFGDRLVWTIKDPFELLKPEVLRKIAVNNIRQETEAALRAVTEILLIEEIELAAQKFKANVKEDRKQFRHHFNCQPLFDRYKQEMKEAIKTIFDSAEEAQTILGWARVREILEKIL